MEEHDELNSKQKKTQKNFIEVVSKIFDGYYNPKIEMQTFLFLNCCSFTVVKGIRVSVSSQKRQLHLREKLKGGYSIYMKK